MIRKRICQLLLEVIAPAELVEGELNQNRTGELIPTDTVRESAFVHHLAVYVSQRLRICSQILRVATAGGTDAARRAGSNTASDDNTQRMPMPAGR